MKSSLELRKFVAPEIIMGIDARLLAGRYLTNFMSKKPFIVTDRNVSGQEWFLDVIKEIENQVLEYYIFDEVSPNPRDSEVMNGVELFLSEKCDLIIAIGGGSPIDCAKGISIVSGNGGHILDYEGVDEITLPGPPLICIPSTSGASADVSQFAIILDTENMIKKAIISKKVVPDLALIDPVPLMTMDIYLTACTGMDALTHAIEAYVSNASSPLTDVHALEAINLITNNITNAIKSDRDIETMYKMMLGSLEAGLAFSNASLGAVHALAHSLGGLLDLPHGQCNSILLEHIVELNFDASPKRYKKIASIFGSEHEHTKKSLTSQIRVLRENVGIDPFAYVSGFTKDIIENLTKEALSDPCILTNPRTLNSEEVNKVYERILKPKK